MRCKGGLPRSVSPFWGCDMATVRQKLTTEYTITLTEQEAKTLARILRDTRGREAQDLFNALSALPGEHRWHKLDDTPSDVFEVRGRKPGACNDNRKFTRGSVIGTWKVDGIHLTGTQGNDNYYDWFEPWDR